MADETRDGAAAAAMDGGKMTIKKLYDLLEVFRSETKSSSEKNKDEINNTITTSIQSLKDDLSKDIAANTAKIATNTSDIATNTSDIAANTAKTSANAADIKDLQDRLKATEDRLLKQELNANYMAQRERRTSMKLNGYVVSDEAELFDSDKLAYKVYVDLFNPILEKAKAAGKITAVPAVSEIVEIVHVLPIPKQNENPVGAPQPEKKIPQIQVKFRTIRMKKLVCSFKKDHLNAFNAGSGSTHLVDDRTPVNGKCMAMLRAANEVDEMSVQIRNSRIRFRKKGDQKLYLVKNPFSSTVDECIKWTYF